MNLNKIKSIYDNVGFVVLRKILNDKEIYDLKQNIERYFKNLKQTNKKVKINYILKSKKKIISSLHNLPKLKFIANIQKKKKILKIVSKILNNTPKKFGAEIFAKPAKIGKAIPAHQDNYYWCTINGSGLTIWIAINASNKKNGGLYYYEGSHKLGLLEHEISYVKGTSQKIKYLDGIKKFKKTFPQLYPGDCLIHSSLIVHGSENNSSNYPRLGFTLRYINKHDKFDKIKIKNYMIALKKSESKKK